MNFMKVINDDSISSVVRYVRYKPTYKKNKSWFSKKKASKEEMEHIAKSQQSN
jgi:hypothetical protein